MILGTFIARVVNKFTKVVHKQLLIMSNACRANAFTASNAPRAPPPGPSR